MSEDIATAYWDAVEVGDPTPPWEDQGDEPLCWALNDDGYACGRPLNHAGQHVAPMSHGIAATWSQS